MAAHPLPTPLKVLAVSADVARHAPVRALLKTAEIEHVTSLEQALEAVNDHHVVLVDREIEPPGSVASMTISDGAGVTAPSVAPARSR